MFSSLSLHLSFEAVSLLSFRACIFSARPEASKPQQIPLALPSVKPQLQAVLDAWLIIMCVLRSKLWSS